MGIPRWSEPIIVTRPELGSEFLSWAYNGSYDCDAQLVLLESLPGNRALVVWDQANTDALDRFIYAQVVGLSGRAPVLLGSPTLVRSYLGSYSVAYWPSSLHRANDSQVVLMLHYLEKAGGTGVQPEMILLDTAGDVVTVRDSLADPYWNADYNREKHTIIGAPGSPTFLLLVGIRGANSPPAVPRLEATKVTVSGNALSLGTPVIVLTETGTSYANFWDFSALSPTQIFIRDVYSGALEGERDVIIDFAGTPIVTGTLIRDVWASVWEEREQTRHGSSGSSGKAWQWTKAVPFEVPEYHYVYVEEITAPAGSPVITQISRAPLRWLEGSSSTYIDWGIVGGDYWYVIREQPNGKPAGVLIGRTAGDTVLWIDPLTGNSAPFERPSFPQTYDPFFLGDILTLGLAPVQAGSFVAWWDDGYEKITDSHNHIALAFVSGDTPPLRLIQRDDQLGSHGHARMSGTGAANPASSMQKSRGRIIKNTSHGYR